MDISDISTEKICDTLNSIGLEVDSLKKVRVPSGVVVGFVKECEKHPNADKLSVCQVDVGDETLQIVCGAKNVKAGQYVPVAKVGATLGENFKIKKAKLRGVESHGMICSAEEIGLPKINDGILELDASIGELKIGKELKEFDAVNDDIIDIELTANRGDCLSILGVARDLSASFEKEIYHVEDIEDEDSSLGIGRILSLNVKEKNSSSLLYRIFAVEEMKYPLLLKLRLAFADKGEDDVFDAYRSYAMHSTGVIMKLYSCDKLINSDTQKCEISLEKDENGVEYIKISDKISYIGFDEDEELKPSIGDSRVIFEESYIDPEIISRAGKYIKKKNDKIFYHASRGSEPDLGFGSVYFKHLMNRYTDVKWYKGVETIDNAIEKVVVNIHISKVNALIGQEIDKSEIVKILKNLGFVVRMKDEFDLLSVEVPLYRHDIQNQQDVVEEIVRIVGIDNIKSSPLVYVESNNQNEAYKKYKKKLDFRKKASSVGFFEIVNYVFTDGEKMNRLGLSRVQDDKELINPVTNELDALRSSLVIGLIETAQRNIKYGKKSIRLFEIGTVFDKNRDESLRFSFIFSGEVERAALRNHGKPKVIDFFTFAQKISSVIGEFEIRKSDNAPKYMSPYEYGVIVKDGKDIGYIGRVHMDYEKEYGLFKSYLCELDFERLEIRDVKAVGYSKYPSLERDFSFLVDKNISYLDIKNIIEKDRPKEIVKVFPIDIFESPQLKDKVSLTVRFIIQSDEKTLNDEEVNAILTPILENLNKKGIEIR